MIFSIYKIRAVKRLTRLYFEVVRLLDLPLGSLCVVTKTVVNHFVLPSFFNHAQRDVPIVRRMKNETVQGT